MVEISDIHPSDVVEKTLASRTNKFEYEEQSTQIKYKVMLIGMLSLHLLLVLYVNLPTFKGSVRGDIHAAIGDIMEEIKKEKKPEGISDEIMSAIYGDHLSSLGLESLGSHPCFPNRVTRGIFSKLALTKSIPTTRKKKSDSNHEQADAEERRKKEAIDFFGLRCLQSCPGWPANGSGVQPATQPDHLSRIPDSPPVPTSPMDFTSNALPAGSSDNLPPPSWSFLAPPPQIYNSVRPQSNTSSSTSHAPPIPPASTHSNMGIDSTIPSIARAGIARSSHRPSRRHAGASGPSSRIVPSIRRRETTSPTREDESNQRRLDSDINDTLSDPIASVGGFGQLPTIMEPLTPIGDPPKASLRLLRAWVGVLKDIPAFSLSVTIKDFSGRTVDDLAGGIVKKLLSDVETYEPTHPYDILPIPGVELPNQDLLKCLIDPRYLFQLYVLFYFNPVLSRDANGSSIQEIGRRRDLFDWKCNCGCSFPKDDGDRIGG